MLKVNPLVLELIATNPFALEHVGCVSLTLGADGADSCAATLNELEAADVQLLLLVAVTV